MTTFDDREKSFENKYAHDEALRFTVNARRNKLLGLWVAEKLGKHGADAEAYAKQVVLADFEKPGHEDVLHKVTNDLTKARISITRAEICEAAERFMHEAKQQLMQQG